MVQWLRALLAMQGTWVWSLVRELRSHMLQGNWALELQLQSPVLWSLRVTTRVCEWQWRSRMLQLSESESEVAQPCPTLRDPVDCSLPGSSVHGILQLRILEWVAISFSREYWRGCHCLLRLQSYTNQTKKTGKKKKKRNQYELT